MASFSMQLRAPCTVVASCRATVSKPVKVSALAAPAKGARAFGALRLQQRARVVVKAANSELDLDGLEGCPVYDDRGFVVSWKDADGKECDMPPEVDVERPYKSAQTLKAEKVAAMCEDASAGCTNPDAVNYDPLATCDDGSCILPEEDCENDECMANFD